MSDMTWIQLIDKHADGFGFVAFLLIAGVTISVIALSMAISDVASRRK